MPPELGVLIVCSRDDLTTRIQAVIAKNLRSRISSCQSPNEMKSEIYSLNPDILIFDVQALRRISREHNLRIVNNKDIFEGRALVSLGQKPDEINVSQDRSFSAGENPTKTELLEAIERAAESLGYITDTGKVDERLVKRQLEIAILVKDHELKGKTTGLNLNGCGAKVRDIDIRLFEGDECRVRIDESDFQGFVPASAEIIEVAESWDDEYDSYLRIKFTGEGFPSNDLARDIITDLISRQDDESVSWS